MVGSVIKTEGQREVERDTEYGPLVSICPPGSMYTCICKGYTYTYTYMDRAWGELRSKMEGDEHEHEVHM